MDKIEKKMNESFVKYITEKYGKGDAIETSAEKEIHEAERINNKVKENIEKAKHNHKIKLTLNEEE